MQKRFIVALTGASGAIYAQRLLHKIAAAGHHIDLVASSYREAGSSIHATPWLVFASDGKDVDVEQQRVRIRPEYHPCQIGTYPYFFLRFL